MIPFSNPSASYQSHKDEIDQAIRRVLDSGWYVLGQEVESFEHEFANFHGPNLHAVGVANGTDAIALCLRALRLGTGDEVITVSHTAVATVAGIEQAGCLPVLADIDPVTRCICPESALSRINEKTRAIIPVHIFGQPCNMDKIMKLAKANNLLVIEDCSQAHGAETLGQKVGTFGDLAAYSCYPTKNLGGIGDGGVILCSTQRQANHLKRLRQYGWDNNRESIETGVNTRLDEIQAAILRVKLKYLAATNEKRRQLAKRYDELLSDLPITLPHRDSKELHAMHLYVIECGDQRDDLMKHLQEQGIGVSLHYALPVHKHRAYAERISGAADLPSTETFYGKNLSLPLYPEISVRSIERIASAVRDWFERS
jgi:dTDP-4-amino-4,6-dideoxygalactose transaminase